MRLVALCIVLSMVYTLRRRLCSYCCEIFSGSARSSGSSSAYMCSVSCFIRFVMYFSSHVVCQFYFSLAFPDLLYLFCSLVFCAFFFCITFFFPYFVGTRVWRRYGRGRVQLCWSLERYLRWSLASRKELPRQCAAYFYLSKIAARWMSGDSVSVRDVRFLRYCDTAMGTWKRRWWHRGGHGDSICLCISRGFDTLFVRCFDEIDWEMAFGQLVVVTWELAMPKNSSGIELLIGKIIFS